MQENLKPRRRHEVDVHEVVVCDLVEVKLPGTPWLASCQVSLVVGFILLGRVVLV